MRALLFDTRRYQISITGLATRPISIKPEPIKEPTQTCDNCIVAFVCIEEGDKDDFVPKMADEIKKMIKDTKHDKLVVAPFAHLSNKLASSELALGLFEKIMNELSLYKPIRTHFGSDKELLLDVFGHPGNVRFREIKD
jgi:threonyl-tRNA synthetase